MKNEITLPVAELKEALPGLTKIVGKSRTLPVLQTVRINRNAQGVVTLSATDLDSFLTYRVKEPQQGPPKEVLVAIDQLAKAAKCSSPKEEIGVVPEGKDKVKIRYTIAGNVVEQTISTCAVEEYPPMHEVNQPTMQLEPQFGQALKEALACCSEDPSRYVLRGACLDVTDKKYHHVVGTNGRMLFSANSFCFDLQKSVIIPDSKFLEWSDFLGDQPAHLSVEPGKEAQKATDGKPAQEAEAGWIKLESPRWTFITKEIDGQFPNWRQCVPAPNSKWTQVLLSEEAIKQLIQVVPNLPGADSINSPIRLRVDRYVTVEGQNKEDETWTSIPVQSVNVTGNPVTVALNRNYLLKGLRFGLNKLEMEDSLTAVILSNGGKKMIISPLRTEEGKVQGSPAPGATTPTTESSTSPATESTQPPAQPQAPTEERTETVPRASKTTSPETTATENRTLESTATEKLNGNGNGNGTHTVNGNGNSPAVKSLVEQVDQIKDSLRNVIRDLTTVIDTVKAAEKEKKATEREIEAVRGKLRQIQSVNI